MAYRDKTREFIRRRNARTSAHDAHRSEDHDTLLNDDDSSPHPHTAVSLPPEWVDDVDAAREEMNVLRSKMKDLHKMHQQHLNKPNLDEEVDEERRIEIATSDLTSMFHRCQKTIQTIGRKGRASGSSQENRMTQNIMKSIATELQTLSKQFRQSQGEYLKKMRAREEKKKTYGFGAELADMGLDDEEEEVTFDTGFTDTQQAQLRDNTHQIKQREEEITSIVQSISELSTIFRDLADLVVEQGTILDRIDYNLEQTERRIEAGRKDLEKGDKYHKSASKKYLIILLIIVVVTMVFVMIAQKKFGHHSSGGGGATTTTTTTSITPTTL
eukprot:m.135513 g.135513  ORF g.135513 m.135513 type:complete len:328 (-) comp10061_c0_seq1:1758-2741(-)